MIKARWTIKDSSFRSRATARKSFFSIDSIYFVIKRALAMLYVFYKKSQSIKLISTLFPQIKKSISIAISILMLANKKVSS